MADEQRLRQARQMEPEAARRLLDLQLEGIREAPLGLVVACDRRAPAGGVLGRATFPDADLWSCACAIENLWLAARVEGLGVGWVTLFDHRELADLVGVPDGVVPLGWLCLGWPDERPPAPALERAGWSRRQPVSEVVMAERWEEAATAPPSHLRSPDSTAVVRAGPGCPPAHAARFARSPRPLYRPRGGRRARPCGNADRTVAARGRSARSRRPRGVGLFTIGDRGGAGR